MADNATPNLQEIMQKAQEMQNKMKWVQKKISSKEVTGEAGGGMAKATVNGKHEIVKIVIDPKAYGTEKKEVIEEVTAAAINDGIRKIDVILQEEMRKIALELGLPPGGESGTGGGTTGSGSAEAA